MKLIHLSDLHLGKQLNGFPLLDDQKYILTRIINIIDDEHPDAVIIAGDVYDKTIPPAEAVKEFDEFLCKLQDRSLQVFVISGNHDSPERIAFGSRLMDGSGIHMSPVYDGNVTPFELTDKTGISANVYMLPFVKPIHVRKCFPDAEIESYTDAVRVAVEHMNIDTGKKNILVTHQFVTGATRSDSESVTAGGIDNVDASAFGEFDYVALGHIHGPQHIGRETIRYSGTPLKYSFSEVDHEKSVTVVEIEDEVAVRTVPLVAKHDMRIIRGTYDELMLRDNYEGTATDDYLRVILTDEEDVYDALNKLRNVYPNVMKLEYDNKRTRSGGYISDVTDVDRKSEMELLDEMYEMMNGQKMSEKQYECSKQLFEEILEGRDETE